MTRQFGLAIFTVVTSLTVQAGPMASTQAGQVSPMEQRTLDAQLAAPKLDSGVQLKDIAVRYHSTVTGVDALAAATKAANTSVEDALNLALGPKSLTFRATGSKSIFVYPDTPDNRQKYTDSVRTFPIAKADVGALATMLNKSLTSLGADELRPTVVTSSAQRTITVRATPDVMARIAKLIAENDKE